MSAPYSSAHEALRTAYRIEATDVCEVSSYLAGLRGGGIGLPSDGLTPWDRITEAAMIIAVMRATLPESLRDVIELFYTVPSDPVLADRRELVARVVSFRLADKMVGNIDRWYLCDVVCEWAGGKRNRMKSDQSWAKELQVTQRTLHNWRCGRKNRGMVGIMNEMDRLLKQGCGIVESVFIQKGIVNVE